MQTQKSQRPFSCFQCGRFLDILLCAGSRMQEAYSHAGVQTWVSMNSWVTFTLVELGSWQQHEQWMLQCLFDAWLPPRPSVGKLSFWYRTVHRRSLGKTPPHTCYGCWEQKWHAWNRDTVFTRKCHGFLRSNKSARCCCLIGSCVNQGNVRVEMGGKAHV